MTEAFIPVGAYLGFVGIYISAKNISRDADVRKEFYKKAESQLTLLKAIGVSEMEKELESQSKLMEEHFKLLQTPDEPDLKDEDIKIILHEVLNELYYSKGRKEI